MITHGAQGVPIGIPGGAIGIPRGVPLGSPGWVPWGTQGGCRGDPTIGPINPWPLALGDPLAPPRRAHFLFFLLANFISLL